MRQVGKMEDNEEKNRLFRKIMPLLQIKKSMNMAENTVADAAKKWSAMP